MATKRINSDQKGKRGEREAAKFLRSLGFDVHRSAQHQGGKACADLCGPMGEPLPLHIEVKDDRKIRLGTKALEEACYQAEEDSDGKPWCVLWKEARKGWRLTRRSFSLDLIVTVAGVAIVNVLKMEGMKQNRP